MYFTLYKDAFAQWRWNLKAANHHIVADSAESYHNKSDAISGINLVRGTSGSTPIYE
ncbi:hypothetical protein FIU94_04490 [Sulfitobacter sp. THAF37]|uniref:YegP family protein n=1 Tax=Sulfitobacter sp. THAF37 TaxID=2587855 RepID=UPI00126923AE|nr:DUF1508 domain-containing protein [Sulfitobacter sp. THAF37]QFT58073.1 hypothetical protein FIU94_04490 [Sulfitobacter sp. THAF37]